MRSMPGKEIVQVTGSQVEKCNNENIPILIDPD